MGHLASRNDILVLLRERLDKNPIGLPEDMHIYEILSILFTPEEAKLASAFPLYPTSLESLVSLTGFKKEILQGLLDSMIKKGLVLESHKYGHARYMLSMALVGFFEFIFMKTSHGLPLKELAHLINEYRLGERFTRELFNSNTPRSRALIYEAAYVEKTDILTYEMAVELVQEAGRGGLTYCYCRHESRHIERGCSYPLDICISLGSASDFLVQNGFARKATQTEILEKLAYAKELGLMHICDNVKHNVAFICNCCGCCCCFLAGITKHKLSNAVQSTSYLAIVNSDSCKGCGICVQYCQIGAIKLSLNETVIIDSDKCLGCGVCSSFCRVKAITYKQRPKITVPPANISDLMTRLKKDRNKS